MIFPLWAKAAIASAALVVGVGARKVFKLKPDNHIEEMAEKIIESQTGFDVDITPDSEEFKLKKKKRSKRNVRPARQKR